MSQRKRQFKSVMEHSKGFEAAAERARELLPEFVARRSPFESIREAHPVADDRVFEAVLRGNTESLVSAEDQRLGAAYEAIILADLRPPYLIENDKIVIAGNYDRIELLKTHKAALEERCRSVGRVDLVDHRLEYAGTGWLIAKTVVATNRHVAEVFARPDWPSGWTFADGRFGREVEVRIDPYHQHNTRAARGRPRLTVLEVLYVAGAREPDIALLLVDPDHGLEPIPLKTGLVKPETPIAAVGYPAADPERNNAMLMEDLFDGIYNVKRFSPGLATGYEHENILLLSDYTTLGGNSGSAVLEIETGEAVGLHFAGLFQDTNYAVSADIVAAALRNLRTAIPGTMIDEPPTEATPASEFASRGGYDAEFLGSGEFRVDLPGLGDHDTDVAPVKGSDDGILKYTHFSVIQSWSRRLPRLTAVNIDGAKAFRLKRKGNWRTDGRLKLEHQIDNVLYKSNPLDRGHMVRRKDPGWGDTRDEAEQAERDTFHYTNCAPQHEDLNQKDWVGLEDYILEAADTQDFKVSVMTGPIFRDGDRPLKEQDGAKDIPIPGAFWKVAVMVNARTKKLSATGYILTQGDMIRDLTETAFVYGEYKTYQVKLSKIAKETGLDFGTLAEHDPLRFEPEGVFGRAARQIHGMESLVL